ncbi:hypothetical protein [Marinibactrum halimedae]|uniref:Uncharacterized protein n=1 Tax=Marinibactrum halimedae TaxID=1444977 RepID=A0AA37T776_9GAMM|nr:hypothetical protein [Marinibactrum halimedae]MCD9458128.1 hypothetical protein [Marinibactrum halimedae]GLS25061.1 hypothetical protein GCM10007877_07750 [Marinibactrum halimedae]
MISFIIAFIGTGIFFTGFHLAKKIENKIKLALTVICLLFLAFMVMIIMHVILNTPVQASYNTGQYWFYMMLVGIILSMLFGRKGSKKDNPPNE